MHTRSDKCGGIRMDSLIAAAATVIPAASGRSRVGQGKDGAGRRDAAQHVFAQRH
jgi:hypothetical protein